VKPVRLLKGATPWFTVQGGRDPFLSDSIPFSLRFGGSSHHAILTGPNRGGKSSVLRSTLLVVVLGQTFGMAFADHVELKPFDWMATGLRLEDRPGSMSMFESEVDFAIQILQRAKHVPDKVGFVLFDELFHSTNPPDGARTAELFLKQLWNQRNVASFISTHVFDLANQSPKTIQKLCVPAVQKEDGSLHFTYTLQEGICEVSSVDEILREKGLLM
jgi:DNA mismatch repair protein MutS